MNSFMKLVEGLRTAPRTALVLFFFAAATATVGTAKPQRPLTFDFAAISARRFASNGGTLLKPSDWDGGHCYIHTGEVPDNDPRRKEVRKFVEYKAEGDVYTILKKPGIVDVCGGEELAKSVSGGVRQVVKLPSPEGGLYRVSAQYRMRHDVGATGWVLVNAPKLESCRLRDSWDGWANWSHDIMVAPGCGEMAVYMRIDGVGELKFRNVRVERLSATTPVTLKESPADWLDGTFAFSAGQCGLPAWVWKKNDLSAKYDPALFTFVLTLPRGYSFVESVAVENDKVSSKKLADGATEYRLPARRSYGGCQVGDDFNGWAVLAMLVKAESWAGPGLMRMRAEYDGKTITEESKTRITAIPAVKARAVPRRYANGFYMGGPYAEFKGDEAKRGFAELFTSAGATWVVQTRPDAETAALWRKMGVRYITPEYYYIANGFRVGEWKTRPAGERFVALPGSDEPEIDRASCPVVIYTEGDYFRTNTLPKLKQYLEGFDGLWANWEPYFFRRRGCMCDRCRAAFAKYVGVSDGEMARDWPGELGYGGKWHGRIERFRSIEHGKVIRTIDKWVTKFTGGERSLGFIPGIASREMSSAWRPKNLASEVQAIDYAGSLKWIDPWGPYVWWDTATPYIPTPSANPISCFVAAKDVRAQVDRDYGENAPRLMAFPHGVQCRTCFAQPEWIMLELESFFFNKWEASVVYTFPKGCDARYWRAFARATELAAKYEDFVLDGRRCDSEVVVALDPSQPYAAPVDGVCADYIDNTNGMSLLQHVAYKLGNKTIVAVFNFAEKEPAYFTIRAKGAPAEKRAVGPMRCVVFEIPAR